MKHKIYTKREIDRSLSLQNEIGKSKVVYSATDYYEILEAACKDDVNIKEKYGILTNVFKMVVDQGVANCNISFVGFYSKFDYCSKKYDIPTSIVDLIQQTRKELFPKYNRLAPLTPEEQKTAFPHNLKATAWLVYYVCGKIMIPEGIERLFPKADRKTSWGKFDEEYLRVIVEKWDKNYIWATEEENNTMIQVCYGADNKILTRDNKFSWNYLYSILWEGAQLNLVRIRKNEKGEIYMPELIIVEPDYLVNITTICRCFETYADSPFVNLISKISPQPNTPQINLGNFSGQMLDDTVHGRDTSYDEDFNTFLGNNILNLISCKEITNKTGFIQFTNDAKTQKINIKKLIGEEIPNIIKNYNRNNVCLEPSFFSNVLGIQGRLDFLFINEKKLSKDNSDNKEYSIIEQKSGKGAFVPFSSPEFNPDIPKEKDQHLIQMNFYRELLRYQFSLNYDKLVHLILLYSKYKEGLRVVPQSPRLFIKSIKMRNLIAWSEIMYAKEGMDILKTLTPDKLNMKQASGTLWEKYTRPKLEEILNPIHNASELEQTYYLRFMQFIENEALLSKVGNKTKEDSGFATIWNETLKEKEEAGNIYYNLTITGYSEDIRGVNAVTLNFGNDISTDTSNFRVGDIVILYPYLRNKIPDACAQMVFRATIEDIKKKGITLRLRNSQTDKKVFERYEGRLWAIEHDMFESSTDSLYKGMHCFLSTTQLRRDLILLQRQPGTDNSLTIKGEYQSFNNLVLKAKQAKDLFLIIGPPGTGKTSYGLVNLLKEELLEPDTNVLLLSYTNRAVDEICSKLLEIKEKENPEFDFIRIGSDLSCSKEYRSFLLKNAQTSDEKIGNATNKRIQRTRVFCGTTSALNANMALFQLKKFSLAIVDEASQILEPHLMGLLSAMNGEKEAIEKFVLIGDHKQLPAVVQQTQEESAVTEKLLKDIHLTNCRNSLFERLLMQFKTYSGYDERYVYMLTKQGRMHKDIAEFPNYAFYGNNLEIVPLKHQLLPNAKIDSNNGILNLLAKRRIAFVASKRPRTSASAKTNDVEAKMIAATVYQVYQMTKANFDPNKTIGVIVPYRNQISMVRNAIDQYRIPVLHNITIDTVERYQGSQRDCIIYGFTIRFAYQLNFLTDNVFEEDGMVIDRKLNVAITRARLNMILIGNPDVLNENFTFYKLMEFIRSKGGYIDVDTNDYCNGNFPIPGITKADNLILSQDLHQISAEFEKTFTENIITPIKEDKRTNWPETILGNSMEANMSLINYGRIDFSNEMSLFSNYCDGTIKYSTKDQVKLYCFYIMRMHYFSAKSIYKSYKEFITSMANSVKGRVKFIDIGCGPGTCGIAFAEVMSDKSMNLSYTGIDVSHDMKSMAKKMLQNSQNIMYCDFKESLIEISDNTWKSFSEVPNLIIFNFSYFFSNVSSSFTERLANRIIEIMDNNPLNKYLFIIQHSEHDNKIRSYRDFKKLLSDKSKCAKSEHSTFNYNLNGYSKNIPFCYDIWSSKQ